MKDADMHIMCARFDHAFSTALSQVRVVAAHLIPVTNELAPDSDAQRYMSLAIQELNALHTYIAHRLNELTTGISDPVEAARAVLAFTQQHVAEMEAAAAAIAEPPMRESPDGERVEVSIH
ncbi:hypothetical protein [Paraburkholderia sp.]|uniref:hypothetical protein n=1 Tax=Paraburkholderia sp. TaxID=1926495 RepID=UPI0039E6D321